MPQIPHDPSNDDDSKLGFDALILALAAFCLFGSLGMLFFGDSFRARGDGSGLGKVSTMAGAVRRRSANGVAWSDMRSGDDVFEGDSVFTGEGSKASIELDKGSTLDVDSKSLVIMRSSENEVELDLRYGSLHGRLETQKKVVLKVNGQRQELASGDGEGNGQPAELRIVRGERDKDARVEVLKGQVQIKKAKQAKADVVRESEAARIGSDRVEVKAAKSVRIELVEPPAGAALWSAAPASVDFKWTSSDPQAKLVLEVAKDASFSQIVASAKSSGKTEATLANLPRGGELRWRVRAADDSIVASARSRAFSLWSQEPPKLDVPAENQSLAIPPTAEKQVAAARFSWTDSSGSKSFQLQIARAADGFAKPMVDREVSDASVDGVEIAEGRYVWRVRGSNAARKDSPWSAARPFSITSARKLAPPTLKNPVLSFSLPPGPIERGAGPRGAPTSSAAGIAPMQWTPVEGVDHYVVERSNNGRFDDVVKDEARGDSFQISKAAPGPLHWRVRSASAEGRLSEPSPEATWTIYGPSPKPKDLAPIAQTFESQKELAAGRATFALAWDATPWASSYELQFSQDPSFDRAASAKTESTSKNLVVSRPGEYAYRVRALDRDGLPASAWSEPKTTSYKKELRERKVAALPAATPLPAPTPPKVVIEKPKPKPLEMPSPIPIEPRPSTSIVALPGSSSFVNFKWKPVPGANSYRLEISKDRSFASTAKTMDVAKTYYLHDGPLPSGNVYWRVRANVGGKPSPWSDPAPFTVTLAK